MKHFSLSLGLGLSTLAAALSFGSNAAAQEACGDLTCDAGFSCMSFERGCPEIDCLEGEDCADISCEPAEEFYCERAECTSDDECGEYMVCGTFESFDCPDVEVLCDPESEGECEKPEPVECTASEFQQCAPSWELKCEEDADCGEGFTCKAQEFCSCPGSEPSEGASSGSNDTERLIAPEEPEELGGECTCELSEDKWCEVNQIDCTEDADCPTDWNCEASELGVCTVDSEGNSTCDEPGDVMTCLPPYDKVYPQGGGIIAVSGEAEDLAATSGPAVATLGEAPDADGDDGVSDEDLAATTGLSDDELTTDDEDAVIDDDDDDVDVMKAGDDDGGASNSSGGCSVASVPNAPAGLGWLALGIGALFGFSRRRRS